MRHGDRLGLYVPPISYVENRHNEFGRTVHESGRCGMNGFTDDPRHAEDLHAWQILRPLLDGGNYLPWSTGAMRPAGLVRVCNEVVQRRRTRIVECGSGVSTVVLGRLLRQCGGGATIVALEHDAGWVALVTDMLRRESLLDVAHVVHAPLEGDPPWYAGSALTKMPADVDLLVVDGPPAYAPGKGRRRAPALAAFAPRLTDTATVVSTMRIERENGRCSPAGRPRHHGVSRSTKPPVWQRASAAQRSDHMLDRRCGAPTGEPLSARTRGGGHPIARGATRATRHLGRRVKAAITSERVRLTVRHGQ